MKLKCLTFYSLCVWSDKKGEKVVQEFWKQWAWQVRNRCHGQLVPGLSVLYTKTHRKNHWDFIKNIFCLITKEDTEAWLVQHWTACDKACFEICWNQRAFSRDLLGFIPCLRIQVGLQCTNGSESNKNQQPLFLDHYIANLKPIKLMHYRWLRKLISVEWIKSHLLHFLPHCFVLQDTTSHVDQTSSVVNINHVYIVGDHCCSPLINKWERSFPPNLWKKVGSKNMTLLT